MISYKDSEELRKADVMFCLSCGSILQAGDYLTGDEIHLVHGRTFKVCCDKSAFVWYLRGEDEHFNVELKNMQEAR